MKRIEAMKTTTLLLSIVFAAVLTSSANLRTRDAGSGHRGSKFSDQLCHVERSA